MKTIPARKQCPGCKQIIIKWERVCPYCKTKFPLVSRPVKLLLLLMAIGFGILLTFVSSNVNRTSQPQTQIKTDGAATPAASARPGEEGSLSGTSGVLTPVAISEATLSDFLRSNRVGDKDGIVQMIVAGRIFTVENGTRVLVIDYGKGMFVRKIRILEGKMKGQAGFVPMEWVK